MPRRRIAMILPGLGRVQRGAETAFFELARALAAQPDIDVELFGSGTEGPEGIPLRTVGLIPRERFERWPRLPALRSESHYEELSFVLSLITRGMYHPDQFDATLSCTYPFVNWYLQRAGGRQRPKLIFVTQNGDWMCYARSREYRLFRCDGLVCINPLYYEAHRNRWPSVLIPNGVDPDVYRPAEGVAANGVDPGRLRTVFMASALIPSKGVDAAIRAVARVPGARLVVAGDGPERAAVADLAQALLPGRHELLGSVPRARMPELFRAADAFLHMSRDEPFGIVYLEAAASGLPIVAPDGPVARWILGDSALYADPSAPESVADALGRALDPDAARTLGAAARSRVLDGWSWQRQAGRYRDFIEQILAARTSPS